MAVACRGGVPHACRGEELDGSVEVLLWRVQVAVADHAAGVAHAEVVADDRIVLVRSRASRSRVQVCEREKQRTAITEEMSPCPL